MIGTGASVTHVTFRANLEVDRFRHIHIEVGADVGNEDPSIVLNRLREYVASELTIARDKYEQMKGFVSSAERHLQESMCEFSHHGIVTVHARRPICPLPIIKR